MPAGFRRHPVGKTLRNVYNSDVTEIPALSVCGHFLKLTDKISFE